MKIVIEYLFIESFLINFVVLKSTTLLLKEKARLIWLSASIFAVATVCLPLFRLSKLGLILFEIGMIGLTVSMSFKWKSLARFLQLFASVFVCNFLYGGVCDYFERLFGVDSVFVLLAVVCATFVLLKLANKLLSKNKAVHRFKVRAMLCNQQRNVECFAFLDSGNFLSDALTDKPVSLINWNVFQKLFPNASVELLMSGRLCEMGLKNAHYIDFGTLNAQNRILVFEVDRLIVGANEVENLMVGLSLKEFDFDSDVILHNNFASLCV
jgi:hypothetical protein